MQRKRFILETETAEMIREEGQYDGLQDAGRECRRLRKRGVDARVYDRKLRKHISMGSV